MKLSKRREQQIDKAISEALEKWDDLCRRSALDAHMNPYEKELFHGGRDLVVNRAIIQAIQNIR